MTRYSIIPRTGNYVKGYDFVILKEPLSNKNGRKLLNTVTKTELDALKAVPIKIAHKADESIEEFIRNKIGNKTVKLGPVPDEK